MYVSLLLFGISQAEKKVKDLRFLCVLMEWKTLNKINQGFIHIIPFFNFSIVIQYYDLKIVLFGPFAVSGFFIDIPLKR